MLEIYWTKNKDVHAKVEILIGRKICKGFEIKRTENGKPYIEGNPLYFSISHSADRAMIALSDSPVGIDFEAYEKKGKFKNCEHILKRFTAREQQWIDGTFALFFLNWVAKEAYIKLIGGTLAHDLKRLEFVDYRLYCDNEEVWCGYSVIASLNAGIFGICSDGYTSDQLLYNCDIKRFRLKSGERI